MHSEGSGKATRRGGTTPAGRLPHAVPSPAAHCYQIRQLSKWWPLQCSTTRPVSLTPSIANPCPALSQPRRRYFSVVPIADGCTAGLLCRPPRFRLLLLLEPAFTLSQHQFVGMNHTVARG